MRIAETKLELREALAPFKRKGATIGLVATMGYLHDGHVSLLEAARRDCDVVVMSLFVNPMQFGPAEDLESYPRDRGRDAAVATKAGVDLIYAPDAREVYPEGFSTSVEVGGLTEVLCGDRASRGPGHFRGVTTVVAKLFNAVGPDVAYFGQKDAQQVAVIRRMVRDLDFNVRIEVMPTVRERDGVAMSSRNAYLAPVERERATALSRALAAGREAAHPEAPAATAIGAARKVLREAGIEPEYLEARDAERLEAIETFNGRPVLLAVAARIGEARLIDNVIIQPESPGGEDDSSKGT